MSRTKHNTPRFSINELAILSGHTWRTVRQRLRGYKPAGKANGAAVYGLDALRAVFDCYSAEAAAESRRAEAEASREELAAISEARNVLPRQYIAAALQTVLIILREHDLGERADEICERILDRLGAMDEGKEPEQGCATLPRSAPGHATLPWEPEPGRSNAQSAIIP